MSKLTGGDMFIAARDKFAARASGSPNMLLSGAEPDVGRNMLTGAASAAQPSSAPAAPAYAPHAPSPRGSGPQASELDRLGVLRNQLGDLLQKPSLRHRDLCGMIADGVAEGLLSPDDAHQTMMDLPRDSEKLKNWAADRYLLVSGAHALVHHAGQAPLPVRS